MKELRGGPSEQQKAHAEERRQQLLRDLDEQVKAKREQKAREERERAEQEAEEERKYRAARQKFFKKSFFKDNAPVGGGEVDADGAPRGETGPPPAPPAAVNDGAGAEGPEVLSPTRGVPDAGVLEAQPPAPEGAPEGGGRGARARPRTPEAQGSPGADASKKPARLLRTPVNQAPLNFPEPHAEEGIGGRFRSAPAQGSPRENPSFHGGAPSREGSSRGGPPGKMTVLLKEVKEEQGKLRQELASQAAVIERLHHEAVVAHKERDAAMEQLKWARYSRYRAPPTPLGDFIVDSYMLPKSMAQIPESIHLESVELPHSLAAVQHRGYPTPLAAKTIPGEEHMASPIREPLPLQIPAYESANVTPAVGPQIARFEESPPRAAPRAARDSTRRPGRAAPAASKPRRATRRVAEPRAPVAVRATPLRGGYIAKEASHLDLPPAILPNDQPLDSPQPPPPPRGPGGKPKKPRPRDILAAGPARARSAAAHDDDGPRPRWH